MKFIKLSQNKQAIVCDCHYDLVKDYKWSFAPVGYALRSQRKPTRKSFYLHRIILAAEPGEEVDHINRDKLDNRCSNLRIVSRSQNCFNVGPRKTNTSGIKGVFWNKRDKRWLANITINYKTIHLGYFKQKQDAAAARQEAELRYERGEFARLNEV